jgi:hypothetical protein
MTKIALAIDNLLGHRDAHVLSELANPSISRQGVPSRQKFSRRPRRSPQLLYRASGLVLCGPTREPRDVRFRAAIESTADAPRSAPGRRSRGAGRDRRAGLWLATAGKARQGRPCGRYAVR